MPSHYHRSRWTGRQSLPYRWCRRWLRTRFWSFLYFSLLRPGPYIDRDNKENCNPPPPMRGNAFFPRRQHHRTTRIAGPPAFAFASNAHGLDGCANHNGDHVLTLEAAHRLDGYAGHHAIVCRHSDFVAMPAKTATEYLPAQQSQTIHCPCCIV